MFNNKFEFGDKFKKFLDLIDYNSNDHDLKCAESLTGDYKDWILPSGNFHDSLEIERIGQPIADAFYRDCMKAESVTRYDYNNPAQQSLQKCDIDCSIELHPKALDIYHLNVSEKFRQCDTGDMCIEIWRDFENNKPGWAVKPLSTDVGPDMYLYVTPKYFYEVWAAGWFKEMIKSIQSQWSWEKVKELIDKNISYDHNGSIPIQVCGHDATLIKSWTKMGKTKWYGVCICIPWETLSNEFFVDINKYDRNYNRLKIIE